MTLRKYELTVGVFSESPESSSKTADAVLITELDMTCEIKADNGKSGTSSDDTAINITNLPKEIRSELKRQGCMVMLKAGYDDGELPVLYVGTVIHTRTAVNGNDMVTTVIASTDMQERTSNKISQSFRPNIKVSDVIMTLVSAMGMTRGHIDLSSLKDKQYGSGMAVYGKVSDELNVICGENNLRWFVTNKRINIQPYRPNQVITVPVWDLFPQNLLGSIQETYSQTRTPAKKATKTKPAVNMQTVTKSAVSVSVHLDGRISVGSYVRLNDVGDFAGVYRIESLNHRMGYRSGDWSTSLELLPV